MSMKCLVQNNYSTQSYYNLRGLLGLSLIPNFCFSLFHLSVAVLLRVDYSFNSLYLPTDRRKNSLFSGHSTNIDRLFREVWTAHLSEQLIYFAILVSWKCSNIKSGEITIAADIKIYYLDEIFNVCLTQENSLVKC